MEEGYIGFYQGVGLYHENYVKELLNIINEYDEAADKFITKIKTGKAKSVETYNDLLKCREKSNNILNGNTVI